MKTKLISMVGAMALTGLTAATALASNFNGVYGGVNGGFEAFNDKSWGTDLGSQGIDMGVFAGYGQKVGNAFYLGAEIGTDWGNAAESNKTGATNRHTYDYNADLRAGVFPIDNTLGFAKIGGVRSEFDENFANTTTGDNGLQAGLGVESAISNKLTARVDWTYTDYQSFNVGGNTFSPTSNTVKLGVAYNF